MTTTATPLAQARFAALKAWRGEVARSHGLPAYVILHDATLAAMAREQPATPQALAGISGVGDKKLQAYGAEILRVLGGAAPQAAAAPGQDDEGPEPDI